MAGETITRGRPALPEHDSQPGAGITRLRPTWRGVSVALVAIILLAVAVGTGDSTLLLVLAAVAVPLVIAPVVVLGRARRAAGTEVHMMVTPPLVPVGQPLARLGRL
jgi:peptidoglycan/LPS O-acetylase OafA/YrhL